MTVTAWRGLSAARAPLVHGIGGHYSVALSVCSESAEISVLLISQVCGSL